MKPNRLLIKMALVVFGSISILTADSASEISDFSAFEKTAIQKLKPSEILSAKGTLMELERAISVETCYLVASPTEKVLEHLKVWDQTPYSDLGVFIQGTPGTGETPDFSKLIFIPSLRPVSKLMDKTRDTRENSSDLHLCSSEAALISKQASGLDANGLSNLWAKILSQRLVAYKAGGVASLPCYEVGRQKVKVSDDVKSILEEQPTVSKRFSELFAQINQAPAEGHHYWQLIQVDGLGVLVMGTIYTRSLPSGATQVVDLQWFVSGGYYCAFTCYELHPLSVGSTQGTLIWRGDYTSISMKQMRKGVERLFSENIMIQEIKKSIRYFLEDLKKK